jgi:hypothetical protein
MVYSLLQLGGVLSDSGMQFVDSCCAELSRSLIRPASVRAVCLITGDA